MCQHPLAQFKGNFSYSTPRNLTDNELHHLFELQKKIVTYVVQFALIALVILSHVTLNTHFGVFLTGGGVTFSEDICIPFSSSVAQ